MRLLGALAAGSLLLSTALAPRSADAARRRVVVIEEDDEEQPERLVTVTLSPLHLIGPSVEVTAEVRLARTISVAVIGGYGRMPLRDWNGTFFDVGGQFRHYLTGDFAGGGLHVGAEVLYLRAPRDVDATADGADLTTSALVGWKLVTRVGFTIESQFGVSWLAVPQRRDGTGRPLRLLGNLGVGWTF